MEHRCFKEPLPTVGLIATLVNGELCGDATLLIKGLAGVRSAQSGEISFIAESKLESLIQETQATVVLVERSFNEQTRTPIIKVDSPSLSFSLVAESFLIPLRSPRPGIHLQAVIAENVQLGSNVSIGPYVVIEEGVEIGSGTILEPFSFVGASSKLGQDCHIYPHVSLREGSLLGDRVIVHGGTVIGSDGFGYVLVEGVQKKIPQVGIVVIEDDVEIGANVTIDRARFDETRIGARTKIDNQVQIAHNVVIGKDSIIIAQSGIAGSTSLGDRVTMAAQSGTVGHICIGDDVVLGARSGVTKNIKNQSFVSGFPAIAHDKERKIMGLRNRLPQWVQRIKDLEQELKSLRGRLDED